MLTTGTGGAGSAMRGTMEQELTNGSQDRAPVGGEGQ
jgi:hypothetical protein